ncbi:MAG: prepilin-type N-terminal cleavage/methylation domain-containing protein [Thermoguttaceae bacterium]
MSPRSRRAGRPSRGFTFLELIVSLVVFSVAVAGLFPLLVILSRELQPLEKKATDGVVTYDCRSPARDGATTGTGLSYVQHTWYLTPFNEPWARKLGAGVQIALTDTSFNSASPTSTALPVVTSDDDDDTTDADGDGLEDYTQVGNIDTGPWSLGATGSSIAGRDDYHYYPSLPTAKTPGYAYWYFTVTKAGWYVIEATWPTSTGLTLATDAQFGISINSGTETVVSINQQVAPGDEQDSAGTGWAKLAEPVYLAAATRVTVSLHARPSDDTTSYVLADGVRLVGAENTVRLDGAVLRSLSGVNNNSNNEDITVRTAISINLPQVP